MTLPTQQQADDLVKRLEAFSDLAAYADAGWDLPPSATRALSEMSRKARDLIEQQAARIKELEAELKELLWVRMVSAVEMGVDAPLCEAGHPLRDWLLELKNLRADLSAIKNVGMEPVAVVQAKWLWYHGNYYKTGQLGISPIKAMDKSGLKEDDELYTAAQLAAVQAERDAALAQVEVAQEALEEIREVWAGAECGEPVHAQEAYAVRLCKQMYGFAATALSTLTTGNAVKQIEARALREAAGYFTDNIANGVNAAYWLDTLAEQKEQEATSPLPR